MSHEKVVSQKNRLIDEMLSLLGIIGVYFEHKDLLLADRSLDEDEMQELQIELNQFKLDLEDTYAENEEDEFDLDDDDEDFDPELN